METRHVTKTLLSKNIIVQAVLAYKTPRFYQPAKPNDAHVERKRLFKLLKQFLIFYALF